MDERVSPLRITDNDTGETYELNFNRESIKYMADQGFMPTDDIAGRLLINGDDFWYFAFRMNHRKLARTQTDALLKKMGGMAPKVMQRLVELYMQAIKANSVIQDDEELDANPHFTVEM